MPTQPFLAADLTPGLERVQRHWRSLIRGANDMPFWDDFAPASLAEMAASSMLLDVFEKPLRIRFNSIVGEEIERRYGSAVRDRFADEIDVKQPFDLLNAQASATVEMRRPTLHHGGGYGRLLLPMWGDGRISMLLGAYEWL